VTACFQLGEHHLKESKLRARIDELFVCLITRRRRRLHIGVDEIWMLHASNNRAQFFLRRTIISLSTCFLICMSALFKFVFFTLTLVGAAEEFTLAAFWARMARTLRLLSAAGISFLSRTHRKLGLLNIDFVTSACRLVMLIGTMTSC